MHLKAGPDTLRVLNGVVLPTAFERRALIAAFNGPLEGYVDEFIDKHESSVQKKELPDGATCYLFQDASWGKLKCAIIDVEMQTPGSTHQFRPVDRIGMLFCVDGEISVSLNERAPSVISHQLKPQGGAVVISNDSHFRLFGPGSALFVFLDLSDKGKVVMEQIPSLRMPEF